MKFTVYILSCSDGALHLGMTKNLDARLDYHDSGKHAITRAKLPVKLIYQKNFSDIRMAKAFHEELTAKSEIEVNRIISGDVEIKLRKIEDLEDERDKTSSIILPSTYLPNIAFFDRIKQHTHLILDVEELFQKQTYRSRGTILGANGIQNLVVPVERPFGKNTTVKHVKVSYAENWQKDHIRAIESAYRRAPYYEYFAQDLFAIYEERFESLIDLNIAFTRFLIRSFKLNIKVQKGSSTDLADKEGKILVTPKNRLQYKGNAYQQVFREGEFEPNLSALDLLFNCGNLD